MRNRFLFSLLICCFSISASSQNFPTLFETSGGQQTPTYPEIIKWWQRLDAASAVVQMKTMGPTDAGHPLHLVVVSADRDFNIASLKKKGKNIVFVLNGIHPGEPDGIDASMLLVRDIATGKWSLPQNVVLALIPVYNIGGALNRSKAYRVDQNGPEEFGFRGNSRNLDLNRDFIKADSKEALTFTRIFHYLDPDVFVDNHVSNGADYQHVMTLIASQHNKLGGTMGQFMNNEFVPDLYKMMQERGFDLVPYVNHFGKTPEQGWTEFWDSPRYSSGFASLWHTFGFVPETHMLKPYPQRVAATRALMESFILFTQTHGKELTALRTAQKNAFKKAAQLPVKWTIDSSQKATITFKGYASTTKASEVSGLPRLYYDRSQPYEKQIPFYNFYKETSWVTPPKAYLIPKGWHPVIERLQANGVQMQPLKKDTVIRVEAYTITGFQASSRPYEGHHTNGAVTIAAKDTMISLQAGDYWIPFAQPAYRFLLETLEPTAEDAYFVWNFFDPILSRKEGFSDYVFEETAARFLTSNPDVKAKLEARKQSDPAFAKSAAQQLEFVYQHSPYLEPAYMLYPVYRVLK
jgi:hypothetical protein